MLKQACTNAQLAKVFDVSIRSMKNELRIRPNVKQVAPLNSCFWLLTLFILMDFPMHVDRISMELPIWYFKVTWVEFSKLWWRYYHELARLFLPIEWV